ncbi:hypothetical protein [Effusibacillus lacus]|nr:hypothetical protein [Effusibacillus lacus]TCS74724.1 hypothetical protein EDD64_11113 [Effusibacillus lacus]
MESISWAVSILAVVGLASAGFWLARNKKYQLPAFYLRKRKNKS